MQASQGANRSPCGYGGQVSSVRDHAEHPLKLANAAFKLATELLLLIFIIGLVRFSTLPLTTDLESAVLLVDSDLQTA